MQEMPYITGKYIARFKITMRICAEHKGPSETLILSVYGETASSFLLEFLFLVCFNTSAIVNLGN